MGTTTINGSPQGRDLGPRQVLRSSRAQPTVVRVGGVEGAGSVEIGGRPFVVMAGPCAVEGAEQTELTAAAVRRAGGHVLRGGVFKPRTSPYAFQGMGEMGVRILAEAGRKQRMPVIAEVMDASQIPLMVEDIDILQVGARNMQNFSLLRALSKVNRPVLVKRGLAATIQEWLLAAEYLLDGGNEQVLLCERGIRTFESETRNTLDLSAVVIAKQQTHLPVIVDPSHATGQRELIGPLSLAAAAAGADGLLIEVHPWPERALCDGAQALTPDMFEDLMRRLPAVLSAVDRELWQPEQAPFAEGQKAAGLVR